MQHDVKIKVVDDPELVSLIREKLKENDGYCPCRIERTPETKCICKDFLEAPIGTTCHCGLYHKE